MGSEVPWRDTPKNGNYNSWGLPQFLPTIPNNP